MLMHFLLDKKWHLSNSGLAWWIRSFYQTYSHKMSHAMKSGLSATQIQWAGLPRFGQADHRNARVTRCVRQTTERGYWGHEVLKNKRKNRTNQGAFPIKNTWLWWQLTTYTDFLISCVCTLRIEMQLGTCTLCEHALSNTGSSSTRIGIAACYGQQMYKKI